MFLKNTTSFVSIIIFFALLISYVDLIAALGRNFDTELKFGNDGSGQRVKRQFGQFSDFNGNFNAGNFNGGGRRRFFPNNNNNNNNFATPQRPLNNRGGSGGRRNGNGNGNELIFSVDPSRSNNLGGSSNFGTTTSPPIGQNTNNNNNNGATNGQVVFINNRPTIATMAPFNTRTTASPQFISCFNRCATTPEYNPICGSNQELYFNEQKFNCARSCGADIQIVRRGSCEGLLPMVRG